MTDTVSKHNHGPNFGRLVDGCPRCKELKNGAPAVPGWRSYRKESDAERARAIRDHDCKRDGCSIVCTAFDW
jgi:hypothetical protein